MHICHQENRLLAYRIEVLMHIYHRKNISLAYRIEVHMHICHWKKRSLAQRIVLLLLVSLAQSDDFPTTSTIVILICSFFVVYWFVLFFPVCLSIQYLAICFFLNVFIYSYIGINRLHACFVYLTVYHITYCNNSNKSQAGETIKRVLHNVLYRNTPTTHQDANYFI